MVAGERGPVRRGLLIYFGLSMLVAWVLIPFAWMVLTSITPMEDVYRVPLEYIPRTPTLVNYAEILAISSFPRQFMNSAIVSISTAGFSVVLAALAGYGLSRFNFAGARLMETFILMTQMFPGVLLVIPYFILISKVGLFNTYPALIIAYTSFALPFSTWMLKGFFESVPRELDEAAMVDGCSRFKAFTSVVVPVSLPGIVATIIFSFILAWNEFLFALVLTSSDSMYPVTVGIASFVGQWRIAYETMMAASVVATVPTIVLYMCLEKHLVQGLTAGAVKA
jgi:multiple sugar transport system permease protein